MSVDIATCEKALALMVEALELLDRTVLALDAGAHLDLAIACLRERMGESGAGSDYAGPRVH